MERIAIDQRLTHGYVGSCDHLDQWTAVGQLAITPMRLAEQPDPEDAYYDSGTYVRFARLPAGLTRAQRTRYLRALQDTLSRHGCACAHDCCGCTSFSTRATPLNRRDVLLRTRFTRNY
jgi:hypothetical protein